MQLKNLHLSTELCIALFGGLPVNMHGFQAGRAITTVISCASRHVATKMAPTFPLLIALTSYGSL